MGQGISEFRVTWMSPAKVARSPHVKPDLFEKRILVPGVVRMSQARLPRSSQVVAYQSPDFRGCLTRNGPEDFENRILEPRVVRMSQAKRTRAP